MHPQNRMNEWPELKLKVKSTFISIFPDNDLFHRNSEFVLSLPGRAEEIQARKKAVEFNQN